MEDSTTAVNPADIAKALYSKEATHAKAYLRMVATREVNVPNKTQLATSRNYIMLHLLALNAQRAGAIAGMTLRSLNYAQERADGKRLIVVSDHKTGYRTPATLVATGELWSALSDYIKVRKLHFEPEQPQLSLPNAKVF